MAVGTLSRQKGVISVDSPPRSGRLLASLTSTVGSKYVVAITGLLLVGFLVAHFAGNSLVFKGPDAINAYAETLRRLGPWLWVARGGLLAVFVLHIYLAV